MVSRFSPDLFGRHVADCAHDYARVCVHATGRRFRTGLSSVARRHELCQTEIQNLHAPVTSDEQILRLQVTMHDSLLVRCGESVRDLQREVQRFALRKLHAVHTLAQSLAFQKL